MKSGGHRRGKHRLPIESCHSLSAWGYFQEAQMWQTDLTFEIEWTFEDTAAQLEYTRQGKRHRQTIPLTWTRCNYGSRRPWFVCPSCHRRVGKVYMPETMYIRGNTFTEGTQVHTFLCRHCYPLTYLQRQERDRYWTLLHRADRIAERWLGEIETKWVNKQKGQHWQTFERRHNQWEALRERADTAVLGDFNELLQKMNRA